MPPANSCESYATSSPNMVCIHYSHYASSQCTHKRKHTWLRVTPLRQMTILISVQTCQVRVFMWYFYNNNNTFIASCFELNLHWFGIMLLLPVSCRKICYFMFHDAIFIIILYFMTGTLMMYSTGNLKCARIPPSTMPRKSTRRKAPHTGNELRSVDFLLIGQVAR